MFKKWGSTDVAEASRMVDISIEHGLNLFDTADIYSSGVSKRFGRDAEGRRDKALVSTKATFTTGEGPNDVGSIALPPD